MVGDVQAASRGCLRHAWEFVHTAGLLTCVTTLQHVCTHSLHCWHCATSGVCSWVLEPMPQAVFAGSAAVSMAAAKPASSDPRISIQPFGTPGQRNFVGPYGSQLFANTLEQAMLSSQ